jgi:hypothetical protein
VYLAAARVGGIHANNTYQEEVCVILATFSIATRHGHFWPRI